jgi:molybdopterin converting factor small subunit
VKKVEAHVQLFGAAQLDVGWKTQKFLLPESSTITSLIEQLSATNPSLAPLLAGGEHSLACLIMVNGSDIKKREGLRTVLRDGDIVDIISMISGG